MKLFNFDFVIEVKRPHSNVHFNYFGWLSHVLFDDCFSLTQKNRIRSKEFGFVFSWQNKEIKIKIALSNKTAVHFFFKNLLNCVLQCFLHFCNRYLDNFILFVCLFVQLDGLMNLKILYSTPICFLFCFIYINALYLYIVSFPSRMIALSKNYNN